MIAAAYTAGGRQIRLPKTGRVRLPAGAILQERGEFRALDKPALLIRDSGWNGLTQARDYTEEIQEIVKCGD